MDDFTIFKIEKEVIEHARAVLEQNGNADTVPRPEYEKLLENYQRLLKTFIRMVKIGDRQQQKLRRTEEELKHARDAAEAASRAKSRFLANMSHEIRTPMNAILGFSEILSKRALDPQSIEYIQAIVASGRTLLNLINDILDLSKVEAGKMDLEFSPVNLHSVFEDIKRLFSYKISQKRLDFLVTMDPNVPEYVILDEIRLRQVLTNLISNAVKFTDEGFIRLTAEMGTTDAETNSPMLILCVDDSGIGIAEDQKEIIFEAFEQQSGQSNATYGGTGLGLSISRHLVELMGGRITVNSTPGWGSTFKVIFPDIEIPVLCQKPTANHLALSGQQIVFEPARILIADDVELNRKLLTEYLREFPFDIQEAQDGDTAVALARSFQPDVILIDIKMPLINGKNAIETIKEDPGLKQIPTILITASVVTADKAKHQGLCESCLGKPVSQNDIIMELTRFLAHHIVSTDQTDASSDVNQSESTQNPIAETNVNDSYHLPVLLKILEDQHSLWQEISNTLTINDIEDFANQMTQLGHQYQYSHLVAWGELLESAAFMFDMDGLADILGQYPGLIDRLKKDVETRKFLKGD